MTKLLKRRGKVKPSRRLVRLTSNLRGRDARTEYLQGREYLVVPCVMITEGVLNGSQGAGLYRERDVYPTVDDWNGMPVHKNHPKGKSARTPVMRNKTHIGTVYNTEWTGNKLVCEVWFDVELTEKVDNRILDYIRSRRKIEVSTGLYLTRYRKEGVFNGERYSWIAKNQKPDHLAVLLDSTGACSIEKGCGLLANSRRGCGCKKCQKPSKEIKNMLSAKRRARMIRQLIRNGEQWNESDRKMLMATKDAMLKKIYNAAIEPDTDDDQMLDRKKAAKKKIKVSAKNHRESQDTDRPVKRSLKKKRSVLGFNAKEFWANAPKEWQAAMKVSNKMIRRRKDALIEIILNNDNNVFGEKWLQKQDDIDLLEGIAALAGGNPEESSEMFAEGFAPDYSGASGVIAKNKGRKSRDDDEEDEDTLEPIDLFATNEDSDDDDEKSSKKKSKKRA